MSDTISASTAVSETPAPATDPTSLSAPIESTAKTQGRAEKGQFTEKKRSGQVNLGAVARNETRKAIARLNGETDSDALADVKPKGQKNPQTKDPAPQSEAATDAKKPEHPSQESTAVSKHLEDARQALEFVGFKKGDLDALPVERVLALGKQAAARRTEINQKLEEAAKQKAAPASDAPKADPGSPKPATTAPAQAKTDDSTPDPFEAIAAEHFKEFEENESFTKSLRGYSKAMSQTILTQMQEAMSTARAELESSIGTSIRNEMAFDRAVEKLSADFPESSSVDGRQALEELFVSLAKDGKIKSIPDGVRLVANALWADAKTKRDAEAAKEKASRSARTNGQPVTSATGAGPKTGPPSLQSIALQESRKALAAARD